MGNYHIRLLQCAVCGGGIALRKGAALGERRDSPSEAGQWDEKVFDNSPESCKGLSGPCREFVRPA